MNTQSDGFENSGGSDDDTQPDFETLVGLMRLLFGGAVEGADELSRRLKEHQTALAQNQTSDISFYADDGTEWERLRYALIGLLFEMPQVMAKSLATVGQTTNKATGFMSRMVSPVANSRLMRPIHRRYETVAIRREEMLERLMERGRSEELAGRLLARNASAEAMDELLDYLAEKPEIRQLVQQQGVGLVAELVEQVRERAAGADDMVDRMSGAILRRPQLESSSTETGSQE